LLHLLRHIRARNAQRLGSWRRPAQIATACAVFILSLGAYRVSSASDTPPVASAPSLDPKLKEPYIDVDEWRDKPVRHRYVHGGFKGTTARFAFYFAEGTVAGQILSTRDSRPLE